MKVWLVQVGEPVPQGRNLPRMRTARLADALLARGHEVLWWASAFDHLTKTWTTTEDRVVELAARFSVRFVQGIAYKKNISFRRAAALRLLSWKMKSQARRVPPPDLIVASCPAYDVAYQFVKYANRYGVPVVLDVRDDWLELFETSVLRGFGWGAKWLLANDLRMMRKACRGSTGLVAVAEGLLGRGVSYAGRERGPRDKVFYIGHQGGCADLESPRLAEFRERCAGKFVVGFVGTFSAQQSPKVLLDAAKILDRQDILVAIIGSGGDAQKEVMSLASRLRNVALMGWLGTGEVAGALACCHVGVCPSASALDIIPNKAFSYLAANLPVLTSLGGEYKKLILDQRIGYWFPPGDASALANLIARLARCPELCQPMRERAKAVFESRFQDSSIYPAYVAYLEEVSSGLAQPCIGPAPAASPRENFSLTRS